MGGRFWLAALLLARSTRAFSFTTRVATAADFPELTKLKAQGRFLTRLLVDALDSDEYSEEARASTAKSLTELLCGPNARGEETALVACREDDGSIVGACDVKVRGPAGTELPARLHLRNLIVAEPARRRGVGTALARAAAAHARAEGVACVCLEVDSDNDAARNLYAGLGFDGESLFRPLAFVKYGTVGWNRHLLRADVAGLVGAT